MEKLEKTTEESVKPDVSVNKAAVKKLLKSSNFYTIRYLQACLDLGGRVYQILSAGVDSQIVSDNLGVSVDDLGDVCKGAHDFSLQDVTWIESVINEIKLQQQQQNEGGQ